MSDRDAQAYGARSMGFYALFVMAAFPVVVTVTVLAGTLISGGWGIAFTILVGLISLGTALSLFERLRRHRFDGEQALRFAGYAGLRFPIYHLLRYEDGAGAVDFTEQDRLYSLGEAAEGFFLIKNTRPDRIEAMVAGRLVRHPTTLRPLVLPLAEIVDVAVIERSDAEIAASAVDPRDFGERFASALAQRAVGTRMRTKIVPYAAYVAVTTRGIEGEALLLAAVPTTVSAEVLKAMGELPAPDAVDLEWLAAKAEDGIAAVVSEVIGHYAAPIVGESAVETIDDALDVADGIADAADEARSWLDPDAAKVATTAGARGRLMANLIAQRIRTRAGLA